MAQVQAPSFFGAPEGPAPGSSSVALPPLSKQKSLLSELLRDTTVAMMDGTHMEDLGEEDMEEGDYDEEGSETEECSEEGEEDGDDCMEEDTDCPASGSRPIKIRRPSSNTYLRAQREAHKRFLYLHQLEEMRKHAELYFANAARWTQLSNTGPTQEQQQLLAQLSALVPPQQPPKQQH